MHPCARLVAALALLLLLFVLAAPSGLASPPPAASRFTRSEPLSPPAPPDFDFAALEADVVRETVALRRDPAAWAAHLAARRADYAGTIRHEPDGTRMLLHEGLPALEEAIAALSSADRLPRLAPSRALAAAAALHARDLGEQDATGHIGSDGSSHAERIARFAEASGLTAENIAFGPRTGRDVLMALVVDDGVPDRGHREVLLLPELFQIGVGCGPHPAYGVVCVMNYASGLVPHPEAASDHPAPAVPSDLMAPEAPGPVDAMTLPEGPGQAPAPEAPWDPAVPDPATLPASWPGPEDQPPSAAASDAPRLRPIRRPVWPRPARDARQPWRRGCGPWG